MPFYSIIVCFPFFMADPIYSGGHIYLHRQRRLAAVSGQRGQNRLVLPPPRQAVPKPAHGRRVGCLSRLDTAVLGHLLHPPDRYTGLLGHQPVGRALTLFSDHLGVCRPRRSSRWRYIRSRRVRAMRKLDESKVIHIFVSSPCHADPVSHGLRAGHRIPDGLNHGA